MHRRFTFGTPNRAGFDPAAMRVLDKHRRLFNAYVDLHNKYLERTAEALDIVITTDRPSTLERAAWHAAARAAAAQSATSRQLPLRCKNSASMKSPVEIFFLLYRFVFKNSREGERPFGSKAGAR